DPGKTLVHVHAAAEELGRVFRPTVAIQSGMPEFAAAVTALEPVAAPRWRTWRAETRAEYEKGLEPSKLGPNGTTGAPALDPGQELATATGEGIGPIILLFNNAMYGTIRMHQERRFPGRVVGTALKNPDFAALIRAYGGFGAVVARTEEFAPAFEEAIASGRSAVLELRMDPEMITTRITLSALRRQAETAKA